MEDDHLVIEDLTFSRGTRRIFDAITLSIPKGKIVAIMGPSGTGKTALLHLMGGQLRPDTGRVLVNGYSILDLSGVIVVSVTEITLDLVTFMAVVRLEIDSGADQISTDSRAVILTEGLIDGKVIGLTIGAEEESLQDSLPDQFPAKYGFSDTSRPSCFRVLA